MMRTGSNIARVLIVMLAIVGSGCQHDPIKPVQDDPRHVFWRLALNHHAIVLSAQAPHNTVQLVATPLNIFGDTIATAESPTFRKLETLDTAFALSESGVITAGNDINRSAIVARMTIAGITLADTAYVMVRTETPIVPLKSFSIHPVAPDSNWMWSAQVFGSHVFPNAKPIQVTAIDNTNNVVPEEALLVAMWPEQSQVVRREEIYNNVILGSVLADTGSAVIHASVYYYGTVWSDSMRLYVVPPPYKTVQIATIQPFSGPVRRELRPAVMTVYAGTTIQWDNYNPELENTFRIADLSFLYDDPSWSSVGSIVGTYATLSTGDSVDLVFDHADLVAPGDPAFTTDPAPQSGNVAAWASVNCEFANREACQTYFDPMQYPQLQFDISTRTRSFPVAGTYHYHSTRHPELQGTIIVTDSLKVPSSEGH